MNWTPAQADFIKRLKEEIEDGYGLEVWPADPDVGFKTKGYSLGQIYYVVPRGGVEIEWFDDHLDLEIDFLQATVRCTARFTPEHGDELITVELTLDEILRVHDRPADEWERS